MLYRNQLSLIACHEASVLVLSNILLKGSCFLTDLYTKIVGMVV